MFDHKKIEPYWQNKWEENNTFRTDINTSKEKYYVLDMFPYPSGAGLHVGHPEGYTATDIISRMKKLQGFEVLHPMGFDAFGLPAEQYAIQTGNSPAEFTNINIETFKKQLKSFGFSFDWSREVVTTDFKFYKNTQWIFAQLYKNDLAELKMIDVNWSDSLNTVLANEEILEDKNKGFISERDGLPVIKKQMKQWVLKITKYADELFSGLDDLDWPESLKKLQKNWIYEKDTKGNYTKKLHLKDWLFARQRYWGEPFPIVHQDNGELFLIPEIEYPVKLPMVDDYSFSQDGKPALGSMTKWINYNKNGIKGTRDLNTMPQWAASSWYFLAYILKDKDDYIQLGTPEAKKRLNKWMPVDLYIGGQEHAVLHLMYARFWNLFLKDIGVLNHAEPFKKLFNQGMILGPDGSKMSKSKGNIINPNDIIYKFGSDALRIYEMFMGALDDDKPWSEDGVKSSKIWLDRIYRFFTKKAVWGIPADNTKRKFNKMLRSVTSNYETLKFNLAISDMMIFLNHLYKNPNVNKEIAKGFIQLFSCVAPHIAEELNKELSLLDSLVASSSWPKSFDINEEAEEKVVVIQVNGKLRAEVKNPNISKEPTEEELIKLVFNEIPNYVNKNNMKKIIFIKGKIINVVI